MVPTTAINNNQLADNDMPTPHTPQQAHQREASLLTDAAAAAATTTLITTNGFDALCLGQEDAHVCGTALPLTWVERVPKGSDSGTSTAALALRVAPRFLRTKVTDGKVCTLLVCWVDLTWSDAMVD